MKYDAHFVAVVLATGAVVYAVPGVTVAVCYLAGKAIRASRARSTR